MELQSNDFAPIVKLGVAGQTKLQHTYIDSCTYIPVGEPREADRHTACLDLVHSVLVIDDVT